MRLCLTRPIRLALSLILLSILLLPTSFGESGGSGWFVNTDDDLDDGLCDDTHCSLREAINISNATSGQQMIAFDIPGPAPHIIALCASLPALTDSVVVDGTLEPDYPFNGGPAIAIAPGQGPTCSPPLYGLWIEGGNSVVRGISVVGFDQPASPISGGIVFQSGNGSTIEHNYIGLRPGGIPWGNRNGILLGSEANLVQENIVSGNTYGIHALAGGQTINANRIGTDPDAMSTSLALRNTIGVYIEAGADNNLIGLSGTGNVISGNGDGIYLASQGNQIMGNMIGTNRTGTIALGNSIGIHASQASYTVIGGTSPGDRNVISGNISGISLGGYSTLWGNYIGTNASGSAAIPNQTGLSVQSASYVLIGGTGTGQGNVISGNSNAGIILHDAATHVEVVSNKIGTDASGTSPLGNGRGIFIQGNGNFIGHVATGGGNTIAYNLNEGVLLAWSAYQNPIEVNDIHDNGVGIYAMDATTSANPFTQNIIYNNAALGLDLAPAGVNLNDPGDTDSGANLRLNFPEFTSSSTTAAEGTACPGCTVEVFESDEDPSGYGEAESLLGTTVAGPYGDFSLTYPSPLATCDRITATATDVFGNTSEFSHNTAVGACFILDPSWFFLIEIAIFVPVWLGVFFFRRRGGRPAGGAAAVGGAAGLAAALGVFGIMAALPNFELNLPRGGPPPLPGMLPACENYLVPGSMMPFEDARGMPIDALDMEGNGWMPIDPYGDDGEHGDGRVMDDGQHGDGIINPLADDGEHGMPIDPYGHLILSWDPFDQEQMPIDPYGDGSVRDDGQHGDGIVNPLADDGEHGDGMVNPLADDGEHGMPIDPYDQEQMPVDPYDQQVGWRVDLIGTSGAMASRVIKGSSIPLSSFLIPGEDVGFDGIDGEARDSLMVDDKDWDFGNLFWRLTGMVTTKNGFMLPFCRSTNWMSFQLGAPEFLAAIPLGDAAPPPPAPPPPPEPTPTATPEEPAPVGCLPTFTATMNLTCRYGPASVYQELGYLLQGESAMVEGRNADNTWWWIPNPDWQGYCWVWDGGGDAVCIPEDLQIIAAPPLPTPTPTPLACRIDLGENACTAAGGTYVDGGAAAASHCDCPG